MKAAVIVFPGSNCDRDVKVALEMSNAQTQMVWHGDSELPDVDLVVVPGGFSYGDYLRSGAMATHSPIMREVVSFGEKGGHILGICNGFQVLTESQLLTGTLMRNRDLNFLCHDVFLTAENKNTAFTKSYASKEVIRIPISHHDGNYFAAEDSIKALEDNDQVAFRYADDTGTINDNSNPNGSIGNIAGVFNKNKNILGMMPHPERLSDPAVGGIDGKLLFDSLLENLG